MKDINNFKFKALYMCQSISLQGVGPQTSCTESSKRTLLPHR